MKVIEAAYDTIGEKIFSDKKLEESTVKKMIRQSLDGVCAETGKVFALTLIVSEKVQEMIAGASVYGPWMKKAACMITATYDKLLSSDKEKEEEAFEAITEKMIEEAKKTSADCRWVGKELFNINALKDILHISNSDIEPLGVFVLAYKL